ncbi:MAG: hypothetical protein Kow0074_11560 [Candidatus Zixiibacteriota bacterium]
MNVSNIGDNTEIQIGAQGDFRYFFKPDVIMRIQLGYPTMLGDQFDFHAL